MLKRWVAGLALAGLVGLGAGAHAQTPSEATRWIVPGGGSAGTITVINLRQQPVRFSVLCRYNTRAGDNPTFWDPTLSLRAGEAHQVGVGHRPQKPNDPVCTYYIVIADAPVMVAARMVREAYRSPGMYGVQVANDTQLHHIEVDSQAIPVNCEGAPAGHLVCSARLPLASGEGAEARPPTQTEQAPPPPRQPEPRYTAVPRPSPTVQDRARPRPRGELPR